MVSHNSFLSLFRRVMKYFLLLLFFTVQLHSQPYLNFKRVNVNWPTVTLFVTARCDSEYKSVLDLNNFRIKENGVDITDFTVSCPDPNVHNPFSVSLVADRSGSMEYGAPPAIGSLKTGLKAFIDSMQTGDEATLISFNQSVSVNVFMTTNKTLLKNGVDGLVANGGTAVWDAGVVGVQELANNATQQSRGMILITDGEDNSSSNTVDDLISIAIANQVRVFTIGIGSGINDADLLRIAIDTGGKYYKVVNASMLGQIYAEISLLFHSEFHDCEIQYLATCTDGTRRNVDLTLQNITNCPGSDTKTKSYKAPKDTSTFQPINIKIQTTAVHSDSLAYVPLWLETPVNGYFNKATFKITFDQTCCDFIGIDTKTFLLDNLGISITQITGGIQITILKGSYIFGNGILALLKFKTTHAPTISFCTINILAWTFEAGCLKPVLFPGDIIISSPLYLITPSGGEIFCKSTTATIEWLSSGIQKFDLDYSSDQGSTFYPIANNISGNSFQWLLSDTLHTGAYLVRVSEHGGSRFDISKYVFFINKPPEILTHPFDATLCKASWAAFRSSAIGYPKPTVQWQQSSDNGLTWKDIPGATSETLPFGFVQASDNNLKFKALYSNSCGNNIPTKIATLTVVPEPAIIVQPSDQVVCEGDDATFRVRIDSLSQSAIQWQISTDSGKSFSNIPIANKENLIIKNVDSSSDRNQYRMIATNRCDTAVSAIAGLIIKPMATKIITQPLSQNVCEGDSISFFIVAQNAFGYQWRKNGIDIPAETLAVYKIMHVSIADSGSYSMQVKSDCGSVLSNAALLNVGTAPKIIQHPTAQTAEENKSATFSVNATGSNVTYQWMKDGVPIPGATNPAFTILFVKKSDEGNYSVEIKGACGNPIISNSARLNVIVSSVEDASVPTEPILYQNYPNPFSQETVIGYRLSTLSNVRLEVFDLLGRKIATLIDGQEDAGIHKYNFNPDALNLKLSNGLFICVMHAGKYTLMKQLVLMK